MGCTATTEMYMYISLKKKKIKKKMTQIITVFDHQDMMQSHMYFFCPLTLSIIIRSTSQKKHPNVYKQTKQCLQLQSYT